MVTSIHELALKLPAILQVTTNCYSTLPVITSFQDTIKDLQLVYYWLMDADKYMKKVNEDVETLTEGESTGMATIIVPSLGTIPKQIDYIESEIDGLVEEMTRFISEGIFPEGVEIRLKYALVRATEAGFHNDISKTYYKEYERHTKYRT